MKKIALVLAVLLVLTSAFAGRSRVWAGRVAPALDGASVVKLYNA